MRDLDVLTEILRAVRLRGTVYFRAEFGAPWGMAIPGGDVAAFHAVSEGTCWLRVDELGLEEQLQGGDIVVFPHGTPHSLLHAPGGHAVPARALLGDDPTRARAQHLGGPGEATRLICGHFELDRTGRHPLVTALPRILHVRESEMREQWMKGAMELAAHESGSPGAGSPAVVDRLAEVLLIQVLRTYAKTAGDNGGFLAALSDAALSRALLAIHKEPARAWTLNELAKKAHLSRTALAVRFKEVVHMSPMRYVTTWRLQKSRELLITTDLTLAQVADSSGYESPFSFARAFKREYGVTPGDARRAG